MPISADSGYLVNQISCVDGDGSHNTSLFYSLAGPDATPFHICAYTGELKVAEKLLQKEHKSIFSITVFIQDNEKPVLLSTDAVKITLAEEKKPTVPHNFFILHHISFSPHYYVYQTVMAEQSWSSDLYHAKIGI